MLLGKDIPLERPTRINKKTLYGIFRAPYSGHSYENSARGKIPADSVSLRQFHYLLYLSDSGRIYLGSQYLGQFGGYGPLSKTLVGLMPEPKTVKSRTFRLDIAALDSAKPKKVTVQLAQKPNSIAGQNVLTSGGAIAFKKGSDSDFEEKVSKFLLPLVGDRVEKVKKRVAKLLNENDMFDVDDDDILNCSIIADVNGNRRTIYLSEDGNFATRFPLDLKLNKDGHPDYDKLKDEMLRLLSEKIIARQENV